jgi:signal transduction histidine kinase
VPYEPPILLSTLPPNRKQKRLALVVAIVLWGLFLIIFPVGNIQLHRIDSFVPMLAALMFMNDTITAVLLLAQFTVLRTRELIVLATGYLVTAFLATTYALTFPGAFSPSGWLGAGPNSTTWLFIAWNNVIPATLIAFVFVRDTHPPRQVPHRSVCRAILISVIAAACVTIGITWLVTAHHDALPALMQNTTEFSPIWTYLVTPSSAVLCLFIITLLWSRQRSVLDLWLLVVAWTWLLKSILWIVTEHRYSIAWYGNTLFAVSSATFVLIVLLSETITMYGRLSLAAMEKRRQREGRLMTMDAVAASIAHEINQPLAAIVNNGSAALRWLTRASPNVAKASEALQAVVENGHRTNQVIASIRAMFRRDDPIKVCFDINDAIVEALALARDEMKYHSIVVATALDPKLPPVSANKVQVQQVLLNLINNAVEAMNGVASPVRVLHARTEHIGQEVWVAIEDTGQGLDPQDNDRIFDPLFTTKAGGMGLGLPICRTIIEAHGGRIWAARGNGCGTVLQFTLPAGNLVSSNV